MAVVTAVCWLQAAAAIVSVSAPLRKSTEGSARNLLLSNPFYPAPDRFTPSCALIGPAGGIRNDVLRHAVNNNILLVNNVTVLTIKGLMYNCKTTIITIEMAFFRDISSTCWVKKVPKVITLLLKVCLQ